VRRRQPGQEKKELQEKEVGVTSKTGELPVGVEEILKKGFRRETEAAPGEMMGLWVSPAASEVPGGPMLGGVMGSIVRHRGEGKRL